MAETTALGWSITANIDGNRQIVLQSFFADDASDEEANALLDRANRLIDRMRARYEIPDLKARRDKFMSEISQAEQDIAEAQANHAKAQASLDEQIAECLRLKDVEFKAGYDRHVHDGRQGSYVPKGATKATLERIEAGIKQANDAKAKNDSERDVALANMQIALQRRRDEIQLLDARIAELEGQFG